MKFMRSKTKMIAGFMKRHDYAVVSTINGKGMPESALVAFSMPKGLEVAFGTFNDTRKYRNLKKNSRVALVIGCEGEITIQYEGIAREVSGAELNEVVKCHLAKHPASKIYVEDIKERFFKVTPTWVRYFDLYHPERIFELDLRK